MTGLTENTEALRKAQRLAAEYARETDGMVEIVEALIVNIKDVNERAHLISESLRELIGGKPTEDEIADPVPGGNGGTFKDGKISEAVTAHSAAVAARLAATPPRERLAAPSDLTGGASDYAPDPEQDDEIVRIFIDGDHKRVPRIQVPGDYEWDGTTWLAPDPEAKEGGTV